MAKWEYWILRVSMHDYTRDSEVNARLNEAGEQGWELVSDSLSKLNTGVIWSEHVFVFKREKAG